MLLRTTFLIIFILSQFLGQTNNLDSLKRVLINTNDTQLQVETYNALTKAYIRVKLDSAKYFNLQAIGLAQEIGSKKLLRQAKIHQAQLIGYNNQLAESEQLVDQLLPECLTTNDSINLLLLFHLKFRAKYLQSLDSTLYFLEQGLHFSQNYPEKEASIYGNMGVHYRVQNDIPKAIELFFKSLKLHEKIGNKKGAASMYSNIGIVYIDQYQYEKAANYLKKGIQLSEEINNQIGLIWFYSALGSCYEELEQYDKSFQNYKKSLQISEEINDLNNIFSKKSTLASHYLRYNSSDSTIQLAIQLIKEIEAMDINIEQTYNTYYYLSKALISNHFGQKQVAIDYAEKAYETVKNSDFASLKIQFSGHLSKFYQKTGNYRKAYEYYVISKTLNDSIATDRNLASMEIQEAAYQFEIEKAQQDKKLAKTEHTLRLYIIAGIGGLIILLLVSGLSIALRRAARLKNQQNQILEKEVTERTEALLSANRALEEAKTKQQLEEAKSHFFANVSHEFRTPLTLIQAPLEHLVNTEQLSVKASKTINRVLKSSNRLIQLVTEILDLSKLDNDKLELVTSNESLFLLIRRIVSNYESYVQQKNINLSLQYLANPNLQLEIDKYKFEIILHNYISNAVKFTQKNGDIEIIVKDDGQKIHIAVSDTGIGIPQNELENVFDRYYQVSNKNTAYSSGSGIGLSICKEYAQLFRGKVWAESSNTQEKHGSTFYFEFPKKETSTQIKDEKASVVAIEPSKDIQIQLPIPVLSTTDKHTDSKKILVVEDNYDLRLFLEELLSEDYQVVTAEHGQEALDILAKNKFDLIISDVMMPIMDGFKLLKNLKSSDDYKQIPIIMLTARAGINDKLSALRIGVDDYILKPFNEEELKVRVANLISFSKRRSSVIEDIECQEDTIENTTKLMPVDEDFLQKLQVEVKKSLSNFKFNANNLADEFHVSRSQLFRKVKRLTGLTVNEYIKEVRLQVAKEALETKTVSSVKEVAYSVGFKHTNYFSISYEQRFGKRPSKYFVAQKPN